MHHTHTGKTTTFNARKIQILFAISEKKSEIAVGYVVREWKNVELGLK